MTPPTPVPPVMRDLEILKSNENFKGRSYGDLICQWNNWLMGDYPDYYPGADILFLRGNIEEYDKPQAILDRTEETRVITTDTAILIPVITAQFHIGHPYQGSRIDDEEGIRHAISTDLDAGGKMWAFIKSVSLKQQFSLSGGLTLQSNVDWATQTRYRIVEDIRDYRTESHVYDLFVSSRSEIRKHLDDGELEPDTYKAITGGFFILIKGLPEGSYRIRFGGKGRGLYHTDAVYDLLVKGKRPSPGDIQVVPEKDPYGI